MRCFIALTIAPNEVLNEALEDCRKMGRIAGGKNLHLTLKFLGEIENVEEIRRNLESIEFSKFSITLKGMGAFSSERRGRVLFVRAYPEDMLRELAEQVNSKTRSIPLDHPFNPHITILRAKDARDFSEAIEKYRDKEFLKQDISSFTLFQSTLRPSGPIYTEIENYQLM